MILKEPIHALLQNIIYTSAMCVADTISNPQTSWEELVAAAGSSEIFASQPT